jgi:hypothetical protein
MNKSKYIKLNERINKCVEEDTFDQEYDAILEYGLNNNFTYHTLNLFIKASINRKNREILNTNGIKVPGMPPPIPPILPKLKIEPISKPESIVEPITKSDLKPIPTLVPKSISEPKPEPEFRSDQDKPLDFWIWLMVALTIVMILLIVLKMFF